MDTTINKNRAGTDKIDRIFSLNLLVYNLYVCSKVVIVLSPISDTQPASPLREHHKQKGSISMENIVDGDDGFLSPS